MFSEFASCHKSVVSPKIVLRLFVILGSGLAPALFMYNQYGTAFYLSGYIAVGCLELSCELLCLYS